MLPPPAQAPDEFPSGGRAPWLGGLLQLDALARLAATISGMSAVWIHVSDGRGEGRAGAVELPPVADAADALPLGDDAILVVADTSRHPRMRSHPRVVGAPFLRAFASFPIRRADGTAAGVMWVADTMPRLLSDERIDALAALARQVGIGVELVERADGQWRDGLAGLPLAVVVVRADDVADDATFRIVEMSLVAGRLTCEPPERLVGRTLDDSFPWARAHGVLARCARVARTGGPEVMDLVLGAGDGVGSIHEIHFFPLPGGCVGVAFEDVTERRELRRLKAEFVATVSHELRTPLAAIRGSIGLLGGGVAGELPAEAARLVGIAHDGTERLIGLVNDILDLERLREGPARGGRTEVAALVDTAVEAAAAMGREAGVILETHLGVGGTITGDPPRLAQALVNLLSHAVRSSPPGRAVWVSAMRVAPGWVRLAVRDEGEGLPSVGANRLFQPFQPVDGSDTRARGGVGLGLAIARVIAEGHRGRVGMDTTVGRGATLWIELPFEEGVPAPSAPPDTAPPRGPPREWTDAARPHALVVDADPGMRSLVAGQLASLGLHVAEAADGAEAIVHARKHAVDLLVLDVDVPRPDGFEVVEILAGTAARAAVLVALTVRDLTPPERARLRLGPTLYLTKACEDLAVLVAFIAAEFPGVGRG